MSLLFYFIIIDMAVDSMGTNLRVVKHESWQQVIKDKKNERAREQDKIVSCGT